VTDNPELVHVGWYCWRCEGLVEQPCRSDNVPVSAPAEWASEMEAEIRRLGKEDDEPAAASAVPVPATDRAALRDRIADALAAALAECDAIEADYRDQHDEVAVGTRAAIIRIRARVAVLEQQPAVLPAPADRAAVLREEAALIRAHCPDHLGADSAEGSWMDCHCPVADDMARRAAKAAVAVQQPKEAGL
jgi:hypothetical protein